MKTDHLLILLSIFSKSDWKTFQSFAKSYLESRPVESQIFFYLLKHKAKLKHFKLSVPVLHKELRPELSRKSFQNILYKLADKVEDYLACNQLLSSNNQKDLFLLLAYRERGLFSAYNRLADKLKSQLREQVEYNLWSSMKLLQINHWQHFSENQSKYDDGKSQLEEAVRSLNQFANQLSKYYTIAIQNRREKLNEAWNDIVPKTLKWSIGQTSMLSSVLEHIQKLQDFDVESYHVLNAWLYSDSENFSKEIRLVVLLYLIEYAMERVKQKNPKVSKDDLFELYDYGLTSRLFLSKERISIRRFNNIVSLAGSLNRFEWVRAFIDQWGPSLDSAYSAKTMILAHAQVNFRERKFDVVIDSLGKTRFSSFSQELRSRMIQLCCHYEWDHEKLEYLNGQISSFDNYVKKSRSKMSDVTYNSMMNLISLIKRLKSNTDLANIEEDLNQCSEIVFETWLREKINEKSPTI